MTKKLLLFDGHSIANRAFYGVPLLSNKDGIYTNAIHGFLNMMLSIIEREKPDSLGVAFDLSAPTFRHEFSNDYKGNRKGMPKELRSQIPLLKKVLTAMDIEIITKEGYEADDILGTLAKSAEKEGYDVTVVSGDRDLFQITTEHIKILIPRTKKTGTELEDFYAKDVMETYGVTPTEFIDVKGLMGDQSDNIKGVPGIGEKTAVKLIKEYKSIENLLDNIDKVSGKKLKENLETYRQSAIDSKMLATIVCDAPIEYKWDDFDFNLELDDEATELFRELELKNMLNRFSHKKVESTHIASEVFKMTNENIDEVVGKLTGKKVGIAYFNEGNVLGISLTLDNVSYYGEFDLESELLGDKEAIRKILENESIQKIVEDNKLFRHILYNYGLELKGISTDVALAAYLLYPTAKSYSLNEIEDKVLGTNSLESEEAILGKGKAKKSYLDIENREKIITDRSSIIVEISKVFDKKIEEENMTELLYDIEMPLSNVLFDMEIEGITVDREGLKQYGKELDNFIHDIETEIYDEVGEEFNINSPKQLGIMLFEKMEIPPVKKTKTGYSTSAEVLDMLKYKYPVVEKILKYRQYTKLKSTYVDGLLDVMTEDNKIHSTFNQTITATGRLSSTEPNLQNIPIKFEMGKKIRALFIPSSEEYVFLDGDYSQIELRVLAHISGDTTLIDAFKHGVDIHALTASQVFHVPFEEVTPLQRSHAKAVNFGIVYGISAFALSEDIKTSQKEAQRYIDEYFAKYPKIKDYIDDTIAFAMKHGYVETMHHRRRDIPEILSSNYNLREFGKRVAMNTPIQGTAADIIKIAMVRVHKKLQEQQLKSKLILTVHDELLIETHKDEVELVAKLLKKEMEGAADLAAKLNVDVHEGKNWLEAH